MAPNGFTRYIGYDNADVFKNMLIESYAAAKKNGLFFEGRIPMASTTEISTAAGYAAADLSDERSVKSGLQSWLSSQRLQYSAEVITPLLTEAIKTCGANGKNTYFVLLCWLMKYLSIKPASLLYIGSGTLRELFFMLILSSCGVKVTYVSYGNDPDFEKFSHKDKVQTIDGAMSGVVQIDFAHIDLSKAAQLCEMRASAQQVEGIVQRLNTTAAGIFEDLMVDRRTRVVKNGGVYTEDGVIPVYCASLIGYDDEAVYNNMLLNFKEGFAKSKKQLIFIEKPLDNPNADEIKQLGSVNRSSVTTMIDELALKIKLNGDPVRTALAQTELRKLLNSLYTGNPTVVFNYGSKFISWLYRCTQARKYAVQYEDIPLILYYGDISQSELYFLHYMSRVGFDIIYITPNKLLLDITVDKNLDNRMQIFQLPQTKDSGSYPTKAIKMKVNTVAYSAERELDTMLYSGDAGIFRDFQFLNSQTVTLRTTLEEIGILWKQEARFRQGFATSGNLVTVPNVFAKISGVKDGNVNAYWEEIRDRLTPETILRVKGEKPEQHGTPDLSAYRSFYRNGQIDTERLKTSSLNKYSYLPDRIQDLLLFKLQEAVDSKFLKLSGDDLMCAVMHFGMNLDKEFMKLLQSFDFTKQLPKLIWIDAVEQTFTLEECIQLVLCNLIGFDILIYTPTGYKNLETFVSSDAFEEHTLNDFQYNLEVPKFKIPSETRNSGLFGKLFRKG
ncbi:MAG: YceG family protein [Oscillospiraceae bacterium]|nr:YceG family protein [Oscillospiraceae bacterium]